MNLLLSLHDVTPFHLDRLKRAEEVLLSWGATQASYLLVPDFHGAWPVEKHEAFGAWVRAPHPYPVEWLLHGFFHSEAVEPAGGTRPAGLGAWFKARFMTAAEGEFHALGRLEADARLRRGVQAFEQSVGSRPAGFVAPAWLFNDNLIPALGGLGFGFTEDHGSVYDVEGGRTLRCPVITWATRTTLRKYASCLAAPLLLHHWASGPALRIAVHPSDFDHLFTLGSIGRTLRTALRTRRMVSYAAFLRDA